MYKIYILIFSCLFFNKIYAQHYQDSTNLSYFYYENGELSSMGYIVDGKPDGYWKTFHENGIIKSQGNRKNFLLDSLWVFYDETGNKLLEVNYNEGLKHGLRITYTEAEVIKENFVNDVKDGSVKHYYPDGEIKKETFFVNGKEHGIAREYSKEGIVITMTEYRNGIFILRENINRTDRYNNKQGTWKYFYDNGNVKLEGFYVNNKKNGYFKEYFIDGLLKEINKYVNGELQQDVKELSKYEIKTAYYPDGKIRTTASFLNGVPQGVRREYSEDGEIVKSYIFNKGVIVGEGVLDATGNKQGFWKEFYDTGELKAEGHFTNNAKTGEWKFYDEKGFIKQTGRFNNQGFQTGEWKWFYENESVQKTENFRNGKLDGLTIEYDENNNVIAKGNYEEGYEDGFWFYITNDYKQEGVFSFGRKNGIWKHFYNDGTLKFEGRFLDDYEDGKHIYYWDNGRIKEERTYIMGNPEGVWKKYTPEGILSLYVDYKRGIEYSYDGVVIRPILTD